jgi:hypothetical protein
MLRVRWLQVIPKGIRGFQADKYVARELCKYVVHPFSDIIDLDWISGE